MASFDHVHFARALKARAPQATAVPSTSATAMYESAATAAAAATATPSVATVTPIPHNVPALIGVISVLVVIILGLVSWRVWAWRVRKRSQQNGTSNEKQRNSTSKGSLFGWSDDHEAGRPQTVVLSVPPAAPAATWVPQVRPWAPVRRSSETAPAPAPMTITITGAPEVTTPPPAYLSGDKAAAGSALALKSTWEADTPLTPAAAQSLASPPPPSPARTSSFAHQQSVHPPSGHVRRSSSQSSAASADAAEKNPQRLPRSMAVTQTFAPSMADELTVAVGEKVRMLEEYADGWCLAERGGVRGVVPRFCLSERDRRSRTASTRAAGSPPASSPSPNRI